MVAHQKRPDTRSAGKVRPFPQVVAQGRRAGGTSAEALLPQNVEAEAAVLGALLIDPDAMAEAARLLAPEDFYRDAHRVIFAGALARHGRGEPVELIALCDDLERAGTLEDVGGAPYVGGLANGVAHSSLLATHARIVKRTAVHRGLIRAAGQIAALAYTDPDAAAALAMADAAVAAVRDAARLDTRFHLLSLPELDALPLPRWLVGDTLQRDTVAMAYGRHSTGKSFLCIDLALHVAAGLPWRGLAVAGGPVVYVAAEGGRGAGLRTRAWRQARGMADVPAFSLVAEAVQLLDAGAVAEFVATLETLATPPVLVVIDTLGRSMSGGEEESNSDAHELVTAADRIRRATGACVLLVHHSGKDEGRGPRGASAFADDIDTILHLLREEEDGTTTVRCDKQKDSERFAPFTFTLTKVALDAYADVSSCVIEPAEVRPASAPARLSETQSAVLGCLAGRPEGLTATEWLVASDKAERTFYRAVEQLGTWGLVMHVAGRYHLAPTGLDFLP